MIEETSPAATRPLPLEGRLAVAVCAVLGLYGATLFVTTFFHDGLVGREFNAPGTDWMVYYEAARAFLGGHAALAYAPDDFSAHVDAVYAGWLYQPLRFHPWVYPPQFLLLLAPFALLPFLGSYALFEGATFAAFAAALWQRGRANMTLTLTLLAAPAAVMTLIVGQNSFLSAALLIGGFRLLERRPVLAGVLLGLLTYKPQLWLMVPVALVAGRCWRALGVALLTALAAALVALALAPDAFRAWLDFAMHTAPSQEFYAKWLPNLLFGFSPYIIALLLHAPAALAAGFQAAAIGLGAAAVAWAFHRPMRAQARLAVVLASTFLAAPHVQCYDFILLAAAVLLIFSDHMRVGFLSGELPVLFMAWVLPIFLPIGSVIGFSAPFATAALIAYAMAAERRRRPRDPSLLAPQRI